MKKIVVLVLFCLILVANIVAQTKTVEKQPKPLVSSQPVIRSIIERINLMGYAQIGYTASDEKGVDVTNNFDVKRIIFMADANITDKWHAFFMSDLNNNASLLEIYTEYTFCDPLTVKVGQFKIPFGIENQMSPTVVELIDVYALSTRKMICSDPTTGSTSGRDIGMMVHGEFFETTLQYNFALINGQGINTADVNNSKDLVASIDYSGVDNLLLNLSAYYGTACAMDNQACFAGRIKNGDDYYRQRYSIGARYMNDLFSLRSEYIYGKDERLKSDGFYVTGALNLMREMQVLASYDYYNPDAAIGDESSSYTVGAQYWFYPRCRLQLNYVYQQNEKLDDIQKIQAQIQVRF